MEPRERSRAEADPTVDVRSDAVVDLRDIDSGRPRPCPACAAPGYLDRIDPRARRQVEHCTSCGCRWQRSIEDPTLDVEILEQPAH